MKPWSDPSPRHPAAGRAGLARGRSPPGPGLCPPMGHPLHPPAPQPGARTVQEPGGWSPSIPSDPTGQGEGRSGAWPSTPPALAPAGCEASWERRAAAAPCIFCSCYPPPTLKPLITCAKLALLGKHVYFSSQLLMHQLRPVLSGNSMRRPVGGEGSACRSRAAGRERESCLAVPRAVPNLHPGGPVPNLPPAVPLPLIPPGRVDVPCPPTALLG